MGKRGGRGYEGKLRFVVSPYVIIFYRNPGLFRLFL